MQTHVKIDAHPSRVFQVLTDRELTKEWLGGALEIIPEGPALDKPGAKFTQRMIQGGKATDYPGKILAYEKNRLMKAETSAPGFNCIATYRLQMMGTNSHPATHVEYSLEFRGKTLAGRFFCIAMGVASKFFCPKQMKKLKDFVEARD